MVNESFPQNRIVFDGPATGFYESQVSLPPGMWWNFDEALMAFIAAGLDRLLSGNVQHPDARKENMTKALALANEYLSKDNWERRHAAGNECLRLLAEAGIEGMWD